MKKLAFLTLIILQSLYIVGCGRARFVQDRANTAVQPATLQTTVTAPPVGAPPVIAPSRAPTISAEGPTQAPAEEINFSTSDSGQRTVRILADSTMCRSHEDHFNTVATGRAIIDLHHRSLEGDWMDDADSTRRGVLVMQFPLTTLDRRTAVFPSQPAFSSLEDYHRAKRAGRVQASFQARNQTVFITNGAQCTLTHVVGNLTSVHNNWSFARVISARSDSAPASVVFETPEEYYSDLRDAEARNPQIFRLECEKMDTHPFTIAEVNRITCSTLRLRVPNDADFKISNAICPRYGAIGRRSCTNR